MTRRSGVTTANAALTAAWLVAGGLLGPSARADAPAGQASGNAAQISVPATAEEHLARATMYLERAASYRSEAAEHRQMFADFDRQQGNPALQNKMGRELPWIAKMRKHCEGYVKNAERLAAEAERFAEFHRMRAEEMRGN